MSEELKAKVIQCFEEVYNKGNHELLGDFFAENVIVRRPPLPDIAGLAAAKESTVNSHRAFPDQRTTIDELVAEGNVTVARGTVKFTHTGLSPALPIPPTGKQATMAACAVAHWEGGKVVEVWEYNDYLGMLQQLGVIPPMGQGRQA